MDTKDIDKPADITIKTDTDSVRISWQYVASGLGIVAGFWIFSLIFICMGIQEESRQIAFCAFFPAGILSLTMLYYLLLWILNEKVIEVTQDSLSTKCEGPVPWLASDHLLDSANIKQVYIIKRVTGGRSSTTYYDVYVLTRDEQHEKLVTVSNGDWALYIEQEIERFWGIEDQVVRGEWRPTPYLWDK
ncbi:MAG: hypothetical protein GY832_00720 [Chloroflexi bacterium]|nr:hypothetical protein [Chloroflexota bacterium]